jgi:hypothetical protein
VSRTALRNRLAKQCYLQGVIGVGTAMTEQLTPYVGVENVMNVFGPFLVWFVCAQTVALSSERQIRPEAVFRRVAPRRPQFAPLWISGRAKAQPSLWLAVG